MSEDQNLIGIDTTDEAADVMSVPEPVDTAASDPEPFDDVNSGADWTPPVEDVAPVLDPVQDEPPMPQDMGVDVLPTGDTSEPPPGVNDPNAVIAPPPLPPETADGLPPALPDDFGVQDDVTLPLDDGPLMPGDVGADVLPTGDTTMPPPGAFDPNAPVSEAPPLPEPGTDGLPPALPDGIDDPAHDPTQVNVDSPNGVRVPPPPPPVDMGMHDPSTEVLVVDGALVDENGNAVDPVAAGLWHDGTTVYDADGDVVWTGNSVIAAPVEVPDVIAGFMAGTAATDVPEVLPPALPTTPYTAVPEDDALRLVQQLVGPSTGDTYGALADQLGALSADGSISPDEFGAFLVDHASDLGALTIPTEAAAGDPAALGALAAQFGGDEAAWTRELASAVLSAEDGDHVPDTRIHLTDDGQLVRLGPDDAIPTSDSSTTPTGETVPPVPPGGITVAPTSDQYRIADGALTDVDGSPVSPQEAGLHYDTNGDVVDRDGEVVWTARNPIGAPNDLPADVRSYLGTLDPGPVDGRPNPTDPTDPTPPPTDTTGHVITNPLTTPLDLTQPGSSTDADGTSRFAIYSEGDAGDRLIDEQTGHELTPEQAGLKFVDGNVVDGDGNVIFTTNNPIGAPLHIPVSLKDWLDRQQNDTDPPTAPTVGSNTGSTTDETPSRESLEQMLARQAALNTQIRAMASDAGIVLDDDLINAHEQWIEETRGMLADHEDSVVARIGVMMQDQPVHILTSVDGGPPAPVTVTRIETDRLIGERPDGATVAIDAAQLESAVKAAADKADGGDDGNGLLLLGIGGAIVVPAVVAGGIVASRKLRARNAVAGY